MLALILAASMMLPFASQAQSPVQNPGKAPLPFPAKSAGYQWVYRCPPSKKCIIYLPGQSFDLAVHATVVLVMFPVGNER